MKNKKQLLDYLKDWQRRTYYEQTAMSEARFSSFLEGLIEIIDPPKDEDEDKEL